MLPVVMEPRLLQTSSWEGVVGGKLGSKLYFNLTSDEEAEVQRAVEGIEGALKQLGAGRSMRASYPLIWSQQASDRSQATTSVSQSIGDDVL